GLPVPGRPDPGGEVMTDDADAPSAAVEPPVSRGDETKPNPPGDETKPNPPGDETKPNPPGDSPESRLPSAELMSNPAESDTPIRDSLESRLQAESSIEPTDETKPNPPEPPAAIAAGPCPEGLRLGPAIDAVPPSPAPGGLRRPGPAATGPRDPS